MNSLINTNRPERDRAIAVKRLRYLPSDKAFSEVTFCVGKYFIRGPIPLEWLSAVSRLPGKCLNVAMAIQWLLGMSGGKPVKLTAKALKSLNVSNDTASDCLRRMEQVGLIAVTRQPGQRAVIHVRHQISGGNDGKT